MSPRSLDSGSSRRVRALSVQQSDGGGASLLSTISLRHFVGPLLTTLDALPAGTYIALPDDAWDTIGHVSSSEKRDIATLCKGKLIFRTLPNVTKEIFQRAFINCWNGEVAKYHTKTSFVDSYYRTSQISVLRKLTRFFSKMIAEGDLKAIDVFLHDLKAVYSTLYTAGYGVHAVNVIEQSALNCSVVFQSPSALALKVYESDLSGEAYKVTVPRIAGATVALSHKMQKAFGAYVEALRPAFCGGDFVGGLFATSSGWVVCEHIYDIITDVGFADGVKPWTGVTTFSTGGLVYGLDKYSAVPLLEYRGPKVDDSLYYVCVDKADNVRIDGPFRPYGFEGSSRKFFTLRSSRSGDSGALIIAVDKTGDGRLVGIHQGRNAISDISYFSAL